MQASLTEGDLVDVRPEERTGRRNSVGGRAWVKMVAPRTPTTGPPYSVKYIVDKLNSHQVKQDRLEDTCILPTARRSLNNLDQTGQSSSFLLRSNTGVEAVRSNGLCRLPHLLRHRPLIQTSTRQTSFFGCTWVGNRP